ncbi:MAG: hypothetical protein R2716_03615 [Microthrixaceae bacterium]
MRRIFWMGVGAAAGASGTVWAQRRVRGAIEDLGAEQVVSMAARGARTAARVVVAAVGEGREGMAERESELRARLHGTESLLDLRRDRSGSARRGAPRRPDADRRRPRPIPYRPLAR